MSGTWGLGAHIWFSLFLGLSKWGKLFYKLWDRHGANAPLWKRSMATECHHYMILQKKCIFVLWFFQWLEGEPCWCCGKLYVFQGAQTTCLPITYSNRNSQGTPCSSEQPSWETGDWTGTASMPPVKSVGDQLTSVNNYPGTCGFTPPLTGYPLNLIKVNTPKVQKKVGFNPKNGFFSLNSWPFWSWENISTVRFPKSSARLRAAHPPPRPRPRSRWRPRCRRCRRWCIWSRPTDSRERRWNGRAN